MRKAPTREPLTSANPESSGFVHFDNKTELPRCAARALNVRDSGISSERVAEVQTIP